MKFDRACRNIILDRFTSTAAAGAVVLSIVVILMHLLTHFPFFDKAVQVRYLGLFISGLTPNVDFYCVYPTLGYILNFPFINIFPESVFIVLAGLDSHYPPGLKEVAEDYLERHKDRYELVTMKLFQGYLRCDLLGKEQELRNPLRLE